MINNCAVHDLLPRVIEWNDLLKQMQEVISGFTQILKDMDELTISTEETDENESIPSVDDDMDLSSIRLTEANMMAYNQYYFKTDIYPLPSDEELISQHTYSINRILYGLRQHRSRLHRSSRRLSNQNRSSYYYNKQLNDFNNKSLCYWTSNYKSEDKCFISDEISIDMSPYPNPVRCTIVDYMLYQKQLKYAFGDMATLNKTRAASSLDEKFTDDIISHLILHKRRVMKSCN